MLESIYHFLQQQPANEKMKSLQNFESKLAECASKLDVTFGEQGVSISRLLMHMLLRDHSIYVRLKELGIGDSSSSVVDRYLVDNV